MIIRIILKDYGLEEEVRIYSRMDGDSDLPISIQDWREMARQKLPREAWGYLEGAAGNEETLRENAEAFERWKIRPRYLRDVSKRDLSVTLFGTSYETPFILAPIGVQEILHPEGEVATASAASRLGIPFILSTVSSVSMERIAEVMGSSVKWFQLYPGKDRDIMKSMVGRAENAGYSAIVVTVDTTMLGWREQDLKNAYLPFLEGKGIANYITDPQFLNRLERDPKEDPKGAVSEFLKVYVNPAFSWDDFAEIRKWTRLPLLIKGITHKDDVEMSFYYGADGVIISNHGGRQVDGAISSLEAMSILDPESYQGKVLLLDSGIRHAADVVKAMALGAKAVLIGRPYAYALSVAGSRGVERVMSMMRAELDLDVALSGFRSLRELNRDSVYRIH